MTEGHYADECPVCGTSFNRRSNMTRHLKSTHNAKNTTKNYRGQCVKCGKNMRAKRASKENNPGTVAYGTRGMCHSCDSQYKREIAPAKLVPCIGCRRILRPHGKKKKDYPDTLAYAANGMCHRCWRIGHKTKANYTPVEDRIDLTAAARVRRLVEARYTGGQQKYMLDILGIGGDL